MSKLSPRRILHWLPLSLAAVAGPAFAQLTDTAVHAPSNYDTFQPPAVQGTYVDSVFGSTIKRITNALGTTNADRGGALTWITPEYATMTPFNGDNSRIILVHQSYFGLYDGSGNYLRDLPLEINSSSEPRWSRSDANTLYYHYTNQLKTYNISTGAFTVVHTFSEYASISGKGEMDISLDGDHFVFQGDNRYVFVYQISTNAKYSVFDTAVTTSTLDSLYITPKNNVILSWANTGNGARYTGQELYDINMNFLRQVSHADGHKAVTTDTNGDEVLAWTNSNDAWPIANCNNGVVKIRLADATQTCLLQLDWSLAVHISAPDNSGFVYVSTYNPTNIAATSPSWVAYTNELIQVKLDGSGATRWAHHRSRPLNSYNYQAWCPTSRDGTRLVYGSNYDLESILAYPTDYSDVYLLQTGSPSPTPPAAPSNLTAAAASPTQINLTWTDNSGGSASAFYVERCQGSGCTSFAQIASLGAVTSYSDTGLAASTTYNYRVRAHNNAGNSAYSNMAQATTQAQTVSAPAAPSNLTTAAASSSQINLSWTDNSSGSASGFYVERCQGSGCVTFAQIAAVGVMTSYSDSGLASGATYNYRVRAYNSGGSSGYSNTAQATTQAGSTVTRYEQNSSAVTYSGTWYPNNGSFNSGGSAVLAMDYGSSATFTFTGTAVTWIGYRDQWSGYAWVYLDGVYKGRIDTYANQAQAQAKVYTASGLSSGTHTLRIVAMQAHNKRSQGAWVWVDAFDVTN